MRRIFNIRYAAALLALAFTAACSDSDDWQAGPAVKDGAQQVHFSSDNETLTVLDDTDPNDRTVTLTVERSTTEGALTVPVTIEEQSDGLEIDDEVVFADGQQTATLTITVVAEAGRGSRFEYSLLLEGDEVDPYTELDGSIRWSGSISFPIDRTAKMWVEDLESVLGYWHETITEYGGGMYRIDNWMNSGISLEITVDNSNNITVSNSDLLYVYPDNWYSGDVYTYFGGDNATTGEFEYYKFYPHGTDAYIWIDELCTYSYADYGYSYYEPTYDYYSIELAWMQLNTESSARQWVELKFEFLEDGEEFEDYLPEQSTSGGDDDEEEAEIGEEVTFDAYFSNLYNSLGTFEVKANTYGENGYYFPNFLGTDDSVIMKIDRSTGEVSLSGTYSKDYYGDGYFYINDSSDSWTAYPYSGTSNYLTSLCFYMAGGTSYAYWNEQTKTVYMGCYYMLNGASTSEWDYFYMTLKE